ncbi:Spy/CpxP family protein refolding chaperone [Roseivirga sp.]|uniref:Spy/CpxP family protein refolding chaperone n=1 Tax=Roseivirga sp. TaxID=1964215 RepID=UPI003B8B543B
MDTLSNNKYLGGVVIALALINVVLLAFLWKGYQANQKSRPKGGLKVLEERLKLDESQLKQLEGYRESHFELVQKLRRDSQEARKALHDLWGTTNAYDKVNSLTQRLGELQVSIEKATYDHFAQIRAICSPEQQAIFDELIKDVLKQGDQGGPRNGQRPLPNDRGRGGPPPPREGR